MLACCIAEKAVGSTYDESVMIAGVTACAKPTATTAPTSKYKLTHSVTDVEYILGWDLVVSRCPDLDDYDEIEAFVQNVYPD